MSALAHQKPGLVVTGNGGVSPLLELLPPLYAQVGVLITEHTHGIFANLVDQCEAKEGLRKG